MTVRRLARRIVELLLPRGCREFVIGDMEELYAWRVRDEGRRRAGFLYLRDAVHSVLSLRRPRRGGRPPRRDSTGERTMPTGLAADLRSALRVLRREPGFVGLAAFTLALGIGSTAAVFGMINELLLRPLPGASASDAVGYVRLYPSPDAERWQSRGLATLDFDVLREESTQLEGLASYGLTHVTLRPEGARPMSVYVNTIYGDFFEVMGVRPSEGRLISARETDLLADPRVAVISERLRDRLFEPGQAVAGTTLEMNGEPMQILGVAGDRFAGPERGTEIDVWVPFGALVPLIGFPADRMRDRQSTMHGNLVARIRGEVSVEAAISEQSAILNRLAGANAEWAEYLGTLRPEFFPGLHVPPARRNDVNSSLRTLAGIVVLVLLIACANVANLLLVRNVRRRGALAMHRALGASTHRLARRHIIESLMLAVLGTLAGLVVAYGIGFAFRGDQLQRMPVFEGFTLDWRVIAFAGAAAIVTALLFGTLPGLLAGRFDLGGALKSAGRRETGRFASLRAMLSVSQIALSLALLVGATLLTRTIRNLYAVDTGIDIEGIITLSLEEPDGLEGVALDAWHRELVGTLARVPGVQRVALDMYGPHGSQMNGRIRLPDTAPADGLTAAVFPVTPDWLDMLGIRAIAGRAFDSRDWAAGSESRVILTESLARRLYGRTDVVGQRLFGGMSGREEVEVIGVTTDIRNAAVPDQVQDAMFIPFNASPFFPMLTALIETTRQDAGVLAEIRAAAESIVPDNAVPDPEPLSRRVDSAHAEERTFGRLLAILSAFAVLLAAVGLYGTITFDVTGRRREFGVRLALGERPRGIGLLVIRYASTVVIAGIGFGIAAAYGLSRVLESRLFGVEPTDVVSYVAGALLFTLVALCACIAPVSTAARVDPMVSLRGDT